MSGIRLLVVQSACSSPPDRLSAYPRRALKSMNPKLDIIGLLPALTDGSLSVRRAGITLAATRNPVGPRRSPACTRRARSLSSRAAHAAPSWRIRFASFLLIACGWPLDQRVEPVEVGGRLAVRFGGFGITGKARRAAVKPNSVSRDSGSAASAIRKWPTADFASPRAAPAGRAAAPRVDHHPVRSQATARLCPWLADRARCGPTCRSPRVRPAEDRTAPFSARPTGPSCDSFPQGPAATSGHRDRHQYTAPAVRSFCPAPMSYSAADTSGRHCRTSGSIAVTMR